MAITSESAKIVMAYCKVCKAVVEHTVVGVDRKKPKRVQCKTCEDAHPYRASKPTDKKKGAGASKAKRCQSGDLSYDSLMKGRDLSQTTQYDMTQQFSDRDLLNHETFGVGLVTRVLVDGKIEVMFSTGCKLLAHGR
jgi:hypothetical protein